MKHLQWKKLFAFALAGSLLMNGIPATAFAKTSEVSSTSLVAQEVEETINPEDDGRDYPITSMTAWADSEYKEDGKEGPAKFVLDEDKDTYWHTNWDTEEGENIENRWIGVKLEQAIMVDGIRCLPRQNGLNGVVTSYEIQYRMNESEEWKKVISGEWDAKDTGWKLVNFEPVEAKYIRVVGTHTYGELREDLHMSMAELRVLQVTDTENVKTVNRISVSKAADKVIYAEGEKFDPKGLEITVEYSDGSVAVIGYNASGVILTPKADTELTKENKEITITYGGSTTTMSLKVESYPTEENKLPVVYINTENGVGITSKEDYVNATMKIQGNDTYSDSSILYDGDIEIRGRGNSTWGMPKRPYKIKLDKKSNLFNMGKNKHWVLLANFSDESLMRNTLAYNLSGSMGMPQMETVWVDVVLNGEYVGNYQFCEQIKIDKDNRVSIFDWESLAEDAAEVIAEAEEFSEGDAGDLEDYMKEKNMSWITEGKVTFKDTTYEISEYPDIEIPAITGGYLMELDSYYDEVSQFRTNSNQPIMFKNPEFVYTNKDMMSYIQNYIQSFEDAVQSSDYTAKYEGETTHYSQLFDFDALVDYWLISEIFFNEELNKKSTYMYKDIDGLVYMGPIWDMDYSSGGEGFTYNTDKWATIFYGMEAQANMWYKDLIKDPYFILRAQERYWEIRNTNVQDMLVSINTSYELLKESADANAEIWYGTRNFDKHVSDLRNWFDTHLAWLDTQMENEDSILASLGYETTNVTLSLTDGSGNALEKDNLSEKIAADALVKTGEDIILKVSSDNYKDKSADVFVNSIKIGTVQIGSDITITEEQLTADAGEKNILEVKLYEDKEVVRNCITVLETDPSKPPVDDEKEPEGEENPDINGKLDVKKFLELCDPDSLISVTVTEEQANEMLQVINEVTKGKQNDYDRARAIYDWVASNVEYCYEHIEISAEPYQVFKDKKAVCGGFSNLIKEMMNLAGIPAAAVVGYYSSGNISGAHQWNAVYAGDEWVFADGTSQGLFDVASILSTHYPLEVKDAVLTMDDLQLGYYYGLAVVGTTNSKVKIPDDYMGYPITGISYQLFGDSLQVEEIEINKNIIDLGGSEGTLKSSSQIKSIKVSEENPAYASHEGALFTADYTTLLVYPLGNESTEFTLPGAMKYFDQKEGFKAPKLQNIYVEEGNELFSSYDGALYNKEQTELLFVPAGKSRIRILDHARISDTAFANVDKSKITIIAKIDSPAVEYAKMYHIAWQEPEEKFAVTFKDEEGKLISVENVKKGETVIAPEVTKKEGYTFLGWYSEGSEKAFDFQTPITSELVLIQKWEAEIPEEIPEDVLEEKFTVTFKDEAGNVILVVNPKKGEVVTAPEVTKKEGYTFLGWYSEGSEKAFDFQTPVTSELVLIQKWEVVIPEGIWAENIADVVYNGKKHTPKLKVYDGTKELTEGKDYSLSYKNNQNAYILDRDGEDGKYTDNAPQVIIKMKGSYNGKKILNFQILPVDISVSGNGVILNNGIVADDIYMDINAKKTNQKVNAVVTWNGKKLGKKDFTITPDTVNLTKESKEIITVSGNGNFVGSRTLTLKVGTKATDFAMSKVKVTIDGKAKPKVAWKQGGCIFDESKIEVKNGKTTLKLGTDYIVKGYENNHKVGTATLILEGTGSVEGKEGICYYGQKRVTFQITGTPMSKVDVVIPEAKKKSGYVYTGEPIKLFAQEGVAVELKENREIKLTEKTHFKAVYSKNINKGTATVVLTGLAEAGYTGSKKVTYKIGAKDLKGLSISVSSNQVEFMKGGAKPELSILDGTRELALGKDYTVTYKNNKAVSKDGEKAQMIIKGKGNYTGTKDDITFTVISKSISSNDISVVVKEKEVASNGKWKSSFKVYDNDGKALAVKKDYVKEVKYEKVVYGADGKVVSEEVLEGSEKITQACEIRVTLTGIGGYTGTRIFSYRLLEKNHDVSKATVKVKEQPYNGSEVTIEAKQAYFDKADIKGEPLFDKDGNPHFEIVDGSYQKNDKKGTAKVTIRGIGDFGGEKTITFKIGTRSMDDFWQGVYKKIAEFWN